MQRLEARNTQTKVKHEILEKYANRWASIIVQGLKKAYDRRHGQAYEDAFSVNLTYVDCFAHTGRYQDSKDPRGWTEGSPLIGINALHAIQAYAKAKIGFEPNIRVVLFEVENAYYQALQESLVQAGFSAQITTSSHLSLLPAGQIAVINDDYRKHLAELEALLAPRYNWTLMLLDPYGPRAMELDVVGRLVSQPRTDVIINFPYQDLHKKTGSARRQTPEHERHLEYYDMMYGDATWREIANELGDRPDEMETTLVKEYAVCLQKQDSELAVKSIPLLFSGKERTMFYLFLTTHDPTGALAINEILYEAKQEEREYRVQWKTEQDRERTMRASGGLAQLSFLDAIDEQTVEPPRISRPSTEQIANDIFVRCRGETLEYKQVMKRLVDSIYFPEEVKSAMRHLRRNQLASFKGNGLRINTMIVFAP